MSRLFLLFFLFSPIFSAPLATEDKIQKKTVEPLTVEAFDGYVGLLNMFKEMLPKNLMETLNNLTGSEKGELVGFISNWFQDKIKKPESKEEIVNMIKANLPSVYDKIEALNSSFYSKFNALKPETQTMLRSWKGKVLAIEGSTPGETISKQLQLFKEFGQAVQSLDQETKEDLRQQFPIAVKLTEGFGFMVVLIFEKIASSLSPSVPIQNVEELIPTPVVCAIPTK